MLLLRVSRKLLLGMLLLYTGAAFAGDTEVYSAAVQLSSFNLLFAKVTINDREVLALVDFGSSGSIEISSSMAGRLAMPLTNAPAKITGQGNSDAPAQTGKIKMFGMGDYEERNVTVEVKRDHIEKIAARLNTSFDVIIGWGFFSRFDVLLDYKNSFLQFSNTPFKCPGSHYRFGYAVKNGVPVIEGVNIDTLKTNLLFDTGAPMCNIDVSLAHFELPGATISKVIKINQLSFEPIFRVMDMDIIKQSSDCKGVLGNNFLAAYTVCINRSQKTIYLKENN
jgi:hypothetical protein